MQEIEITIINWEKYQTKIKSGNRHWVKIDTNLPSSRSLFGVSLSAKWTFICLLCDKAGASKTAWSVSYLTNIKHLSALCRQRCDRLTRHLEELQAVGCISVRYLDKEKGRIYNREEEIIIEEEKPSSFTANIDWSVFKISEQLEPYQLHALEQTYPHEFLSREFKLLKASLVTWDKPLPKTKTHWYRLVASHMKREWLKEPPQKQSEVREWPEGAFK